MMFPTGVELLYFASLNRRARYGKVEAHQETTPEQLKTLFGEGVSDEIKTMNRDGIMFIGDKGRVFVNRGGVYGKAVEELKENPFPENAWRAAPSKNHMGNFFDCVKSREEPVSPVRIQHRSISTCHLTNISIRLGRKLKWDPKLEKVVGDKEADSWQSREQRAPYLLKS